MKPIVFLFFVLFGCASSQAKDPLSYLPAKVGFFAESPIYVDYNAYDPKKVPPPPANGSPADLEDLRILQDWQEKRTKSDCELAKNEEVPTLENMFGSEKILPQPIPESVDRFFWAVRSDAGRLNSVVKKYYHRERPFVRFPNRFVPCIKREESLSYPSGHATIARLYAQILTDIYPEKAKQLDQRANISSERRVIGGVHHPSDTRQGQKGGAEVYQMMLKSAAFQRDFSAIKECLRRNNCP